MLPFKNLVRFDKTRTIPVYQQVANSLINLIREGRLRPGDYLPSSRILAELLRLHRKTVVAAYEELLAQDWVESLPRKGMMVAKNLPGLKPRTFKATAGKAAYSSKSPMAFRHFTSHAVATSREGSYRFVVNDGFPDSRLAPVDALLRQYRYFLQRSAADRQLMYTDPAGTGNLRGCWPIFFR